MVTRTPAISRLLLAVCALAFAMPASAQVADGAAISAPAHIAFIDGDATLAREGRAEPAITNVPLISGDRLQTEQGRAEVIFGDGSVLDVDQFTSIDFLSDELVRLLEGRVRLYVGGRDRVTYRIDTPSGAVRIELPGEYRVSLIGSGGAVDVELVAIRGEATLLNEFGETEVRAGERAVATATLAPSYAQGYNSARWDAFDTWVDERRDERLGTTSARYLPDDVHGYAGDFDRYGDWRYEHEYGYVWYPRVHVAWRPYFYGHWSWFGPWGWTWISYDRWGWPTHHYGRWGYRAGAWFWVPKRRWAPAWVYWASAPGYVGWCPLGWDNRPIFSIVNVNLVNVRRGYDPYRAWTVVPRNAFGTHAAVTRYAVPRGTLRTAVPRWTVESASAPVRPAVERRTATPIYSAGRNYARARSEADVATTEQPQQSIDADGALSRVPADATRTRRRLPDDVTRAPRATAPAAPGVLGRGSPDANRGAARARSRYGDLGPGGTASPSAPAAQPDATRVPQPGTRGVPMRRRPDAVGSPRYSPPRSGGPPSPAASARQADERAAPRYAPPSGGYRPPSRPQPQAEEPPDAGVYRPRGGGNGRAAQPRYAPPTSSPRPSERIDGPSGRANGPSDRVGGLSGRVGGPSGRAAGPSGRAAGPSSRPSSRPPDGARAPSRSAPSGGSPKAGSGSSDSPRARPRPKPQ